MKFSAQLLIATLSKSTTHISIFVLSIILSRYFTKDDYGTYLHIQLITNLAVWAFLLGIPHGIYYFLPKSEEKRRYVLTTLLIVGCIAVVVSSMTAINSDHLANFLSNPRIENLYWVLLCSVFFQIPLTIFEPLMLTTNRVKEFAAIGLFFNLLFFSAVAIPVLFDRPLVEVLWCLVGVYAVHSSVVLFYALKIAYSFKTLDPKGDKYSLSENLKYCFPIGLSMNVMELSRYMDKLVVSNQSNAADYATYTRGAMEIPVVGIIANTIDNLLMPRFVKAYKDNDISAILTSWHGAIRLMAAFIYPSCLFLIVSAPLLIPAIFSDKYIGSIVIFQIYTLGLLSRLSTFNVIVRAIGKTKVILYITIGSLIMNFTLTYWFMSMWGLMGAPIATVATMTTMRFSYITVISRYFNLKLREIFPWQSIAKTLFAASISVLPMFLMIDEDVNVWINLLVMGLVYSAVYLVLIRLLNALDDQDKESIRDFLPSKFKWVV